MTAGKENINGEGKVCSTTSLMQPSSLALDDCLMLLSMNKDSMFELDAFVTIPVEKMSLDLGIHDFTNSLHNYIAEALEHHWK